MNEHTSLETVNKTEKAVYVAFFLIMSVALARIVLLFAFEKTGEHSDEVWSYGLANSYYLPYVYEDYSREAPINENSTITGRYLKDYVTVQKGQRFSYGSVVYNLKADFHPPLWFALLHTICSFFPETYSLWFGFSINIAVFILLGIYLFKFASAVTKNKTLALFTLCYYVFCVGGVDTFLYIRHYALLTLFGVMTAYYHYIIISDKSRGNFCRTWWKLALSVLAGCMTQYLFLGFVFAFAAVYCIYYLFKKEFKKLFAYAGAMLGSVACVFAITGFGMGVARKTGVEETDGAGFWVQLGKSLFPEEFVRNLRLCVNCILYDFFAWRMPFNVAYYIKFFLATAGLALMIAAPVCVLIVKHNKEKTGRLLISIRHKIAAALCLNRFRVFNIAVCMSFLLTLYTVVVTANPSEMGALTDRYLFILYPFCSLMFIKIFWKIASALARLLAGILGARSRTVFFGQVIFAIVSFTLLIINVAAADIYYLFPRHENEVPLEKLVEGKDCMLVLTEHWLLTCYSDLLCEADEIFVTNTKDYRRQMPDFKENDGELYLIMDVSAYMGKLTLLKSCNRDELEISEVEELFLPYVEEMFSGKSIEYVQSDEIFTRVIYVYRIS